MPKFALSVYNSKQQLSLNWWLKAKAEMMTHTFKRTIKNSISQKIEKPSSHFLPLTKLCDICFYNVLRKNFEIKNLFNSEITGFQQGLFKILEILLAMNYCIKKNCNHNIQIKTWLLLTLTYFASNSWASHKI